jgi:predicted amidohydrolase
MSETSGLIRAAALQFAVTDDVTANLAACLRMIDQAARHNLHLMVLPEFVNHLAWYADADHCYRVAVDLDGDFCGAIAAKAAHHACYIKINCTVRREAGAVTGTNILFGPNGRRVAVNDKQVLMGNENNFLTPACENGPVVSTPFGALGMYACMDGVINEVTRGLAVRGAGILLNSLNSFAHDEAALHIPVRAAENKVFVAAANKVGDLVPPRLVETVAARLRIAPHFLRGAGESQIVAPDGTVLAKGPREGEAVVTADIDPTLAADKTRPDGTHIFQSRRPELYGPIAAPPHPSPRSPGAPAARVAVYQPQTEGPAAVEEAAQAVSRAAAAGVQLIVLPELFHLPGNRAADPAQAAAQTEPLCAALRAALAAANTECYAVCTAVETAEDGYRHSGLLIGRAGVILRQPQLHPCGRHPWITALGAQLVCADLPFGRLALIVGNDSIYPETFRLAALQNVEVAAASLTVLEAWEAQYGLPERAAENRLNVVAATRPSEAGVSLILAVTQDFTLWTEWKNRPFDGNISCPVITRAGGPGLTEGLIHPAASANRFVSHKTNLVDGRPWRLAHPLTLRL